jgi:hypothetical protein
MKLIPQRILWAFWSVRVTVATALVGLAAGLFAYMDEIPPVWFLILQVALPVLAIVVRAIKQPRLDA